MPNDPKTDPALLAALERARHHVMTPAERDAQRRSWVRGEMMMERPEMTVDEANALMDKAGESRTIPAAAVEANQAAEEAAVAAFWAGDLCLPYVEGVSYDKRVINAARAYVSALPHLAAPADVAGLVARLRSGEPCHPPCKVMDARSGCICAEAVDRLTAVAVERDRADAERDAAYEHGIKVDRAVAALVAERDALAERMRGAEADRAELAARLRRALYGPAAELKP